MCEPATLLTVAGVGVSAGGSIFGAIGQQKDAIAQRRVDMDNALLAEIASDDALRRGKQDADRMRLEADKIREEGARLISTQRVAYAASGVDVTVGSPVEVMASTRGIFERDANTVQRDALTIENNAAREAWGYRQTARQLKETAGLRVERGNYASAGTLLGAAGSSISTLGGLYRARDGSGYSPTSRAARATNSAFPRKG